VSRLGIASPVGTRRARILWALWISIPFVACAASGIAILAWAMFHAFAFMDLEPACHGEPALSAAAPTVGGPHPAIVFLPLGDEQWRAEIGMLPDDLEATYAHDVQLVVCADVEREVVLETCASSVRRLSWRRSVRVVVAHTGQVIGAGEVEGAPPPSCAAADDEAPPIGDLVGGEVGGAELGAFVAPYVATLGPGS
jgi:hypothetical protein